MFWVHSKIVFITRLKNYPHNRNAINKYHMHNIKQIPVCNMQESFLVAFKIICNKISKKNENCNQNHLPNFNSKHHFR